MVWFRTWFRLVPPLPEIRLVYRTHTYNHNICCAFCGWSTPWLHVVALTSQGSHGAYRGPQELTRPPSTLRRWLARICQGRATTLPSRAQGQGQAAAQAALSRGGGFFIDMACAAHDEFNAREQHVDVATWRANGESAASADVKLLK